jgi:hypothetical protein
VSLRTILPCTGRPRLSARTGRTGWRSNLLFEGVIVYSEIACHFVVQVSGRNPPRNDRINENLAGVSSCHSNISTNVPIQEGWQCAGRAFSKLIKPVDSRRLSSKDTTRVTPMSQYPVGYDLPRIKTNKNSRYSFFHAIRVYKLYFERLRLVLSGDCFWVGLLLYYLPCKNQPTSVPSSISWGN